MKRVEHAIEEARRQLRLAEEEEQTRKNRVANLHARLSGIEQDVQTLTREYEAAEKKVVSARAALDKAVEVEKALRARLNAASSEELRVRRQLEEEGEVLDHSSVSPRSEFSEPRAAREARTEVREAPVVPPSQAPSPTPARRRGFWEEFKAGFRGE